MQGNDEVTVKYYDKYEGQDRFRVVGRKGKFVFIASTAEVALWKYNTYVKEREPK
jgi:hypothetical protein